MTRRLVAVGRKVRTGTCTRCSGPVTAVQSALDMRTWTGRRALTHLFTSDCGRSVTP